MTRSATITEREAARHRNGQFGEQTHTRPDVTLPDPHSAAGVARPDILQDPSDSTCAIVEEAYLRHGLPEGLFDSEHQTWLFSTDELGLRAATTDETTRVGIIVSGWQMGNRTLGPQEDIPVDSVDCSVQGVLRRDATLFYLEQRRERLDTFDDEVSFYGADGPLIVQLHDGTRVLLDGNHRWASARIRGDLTFRAQVLYGKRYPGHGEPRRVHGGHDPQRNHH